MLAGLAVPDKVAALLAQSQQVLSVSSADGSVIPSAGRGRQRELRAQQAQGSQGAPTVLAPEGGMP